MNKLIELIDYKTNLKNKTSKHNAKRYNADLIANTKSLSYEYSYDYRQFLK